MYFLSVCICVWAVWARARISRLPSVFFYIFIIFIKLSSSLGRAAGLGAVGLVLKNGIYHPSDFVLCVICYGCRL